MPSMERDIFYIKKNSVGQNDSTVGKVLALNKADLGLIPSIPYGAQALPGVFLSSEPGVSLDYCWVWP